MRKIIYVRARFRSISPPVIWPRHLIRWWDRGLLSVAAVILLTGCASQLNVQAVANDPTIAAQVKSALLHYPNHAYSDVQVDCFKGVVQLTGMVDNTWLKDRSQKIVLGLPGVRGVENHMSVRNTLGASAGKQDEILSQRVNSVFVTNIDYKFEQVKVTAQNGVVELSGYVNTPAQKIAAATIARNVEGVSNVVNNIGLGN
jgi:hyperosmotically inducible protein